MSPLRHADAGSASVLMRARAQHGCSKKQSDCIAHMMLICIPMLVEHAASNNASMAPELLKVILRVLVDSSLLLTQGAILCGNVVFIVEMLQKQH